MLPRGWNPSHFSPLRRTIRSASPRIDRYLHSLRFCSQLGDEPNKNSLRGSCSRLVIVVLFCSRPAAPMIAKPVAHGILPRLRSTGKAVGKNGKCRALDESTKPWFKRQPAFCFASVMQNQYAITARIRCRCAPRFPAVRQLDSAIASSSLIATYIFAPSRRPSGDEIEIEHADNSSVAYRVNRSNSTVRRDRYPQLSGEWNSLYC